MRKIYFLFGIHNHQPVGNFPEVLEKAYQDAYLPFLTALERHPRIKWSLHCTGILWDFLTERHPEYITAVKKMVDAGQVELLSGGYYEPIMSAIPDSDKRGQIEKLTRFIKTTFDYDARGMWLAERVWEPGLAKIFAEAGIDYTIVDDAHFAAAGLEVEKLRGYYITEEQGVSLNIFPISQRLRYYIPFQTVDKTIEYMLSNAREGACPALVMADDGEKFGLWPETFKHVYQDRWLENFLTAIENNLDVIEPVTFSEYRKIAPAEGRVYLPTASYFEMSEWALPGDAQEEFESVVRQFESRADVTRFLRGGFWRNFLTKYAESNNMHKKMLLVSAKLEELKNKKGTKAAARAAALAKAYDALYASECNCASWHGVFGGLYLPHLRTAVYQKLLEAESMYADSTGAKSRWRSYDFDFDGKNEVLFESRIQNLYFSPHQGGALFEWDVLSKKVNFLNVLTRRKEAYHQRLRDFIANPAPNDGNVKTIHDLVKVKEKDLDQYLHYDWYRRASLIDHFLHPQTTFEDFKRVQFGEQGDFVLGEYKAKTGQKNLILSREGTVWDNQKSLQLEVVKEIIPQDSGFTVSYRIKNREADGVTVLFAPEFNYAFSYQLEGENGVRENVREWLRQDDVFNVRLTMKFSNPVTLWIFPLETVSLSESGFERTYQGTVVTPVQPITIAAGGAYVFTVQVIIGDKQ
jgi:alpha-amylase